MVSAGGQFSLWERVERTKNDLLHFEGELKHLQERDGFVRGLQNRFKEAMTQMQDADEHTAGLVLMVYWSHVHQQVDAAWQLHCSHTLCMTPT